MMACSTSKGALNSPILPEFKRAHTVQVTPSWKTLQFPDSLADSMVSMGTKTTGCDMFKLFICTCNIMFFFRHSYHSLFWYEGTLYIFVIIIWYVCVCAYVCISISPSLQDIQRCCFQHCCDFEASLVTSHEEGAITKRLSLQMRLHEDPASFCRLGGEPCIQTGEYAILGNFVQ